jgi:hypothetical protein
MVLYLDYDGVLHADDVRLHRRRPTVYVDGRPRPDLAGTLFAHAGLLEAALEPYPGLRIVLATSWVQVKNFSYAKKRLTAGLQARVIGATYHSSMSRDSTGWSSRVRATFSDLTRYQTICADAHRRGIGSWLALDNDVEGWPDSMRHLVVAPADEVLGLAQPGIIDELSEKLKFLSETVHV